MGGIDRRPSRGKKLSQVGGQEGIGLGIGARVAVLMMRAGRKGHVQIDDPVAIKQCADMCLRPKRNNFHRCPRYQPARERVQPIRFRRAVVPDVVLPDWQSQRSTFFKYRDPFSA